MEGWNNLTLELRYGKWCICCAVAFVELEKAVPELVTACPGAVEKLAQLDAEIF